jgi:hypothetical protein
MPKKKKNSYGWIKWMVGIVVTICLAMFGFLGNAQLSRDKDQDSRIETVRVETEQKLAEKVDNQTLQMWIREQTEQRRVDEKVREKLDEKADENEDEIIRLRQDTNRLLEKLDEK